MDYPNPLFTEQVHVDLGTANVPALTGALSITAWVNPDSVAAADDQVIIAKDNTTGNTGPFKLQLDEPANALRGIINDSQLTGATAMTAGVWTFVAMIYDGVNKVLYLDAVQDATVAESGNVDTNIDPFTIAGVDAGPLRRSWDGLLADIRVYTRALSLAELQTIFTLVGKDNIVNGLLWRWMQNELSPGTAATIAGSIIDLAGNLNGTPVNSPVYQEGILR